MFENADLIHRYTRADALRDGVLIDASATAKEAGIVFPVALTAERVGSPSGGATAGRKCASASTSATATATGRRRWSA
jgi:hypothetical protein